MALTSRWPTGTPRSSKPEVDGQETMPVAMLEQVRGDVEEKLRRRWQLATMALVEHH